MSEQSVQLIFHRCVFFTGELLTGAGVVEELSSREHPVRGRRQERRTSGLDLRVIDLLLQHPLGELCLRVEEDQLPLPPPPGSHLRRRHVLDTRVPLYNKTTCITRFMFT